MPLSSDLEMAALLSEMDAKPHAAALFRKAADEIERLRIENIQLKFACGYPMPAELEKHVIPTNPFKCGVCDAESRRSR